MASGKAIQFFGREKVIEAFEYRSIETWAVFSDKQYMHSGSGADDLDIFLQMLEPGGSAGVYTLKVYREQSDPDKITDKTECNGSFNFRLTEKQAMGAIGMHGSRVASVTDIVTAKITGLISDEVSQAIEKRFNGEDTEKEETITDIVIGYMKEPDKLISVLGALRGLFAPVSAPAVMPAMLAGVAQPAAMARRAGSVGIVPAEGIANEADVLQARLVAVLQRLEKIDPNILETLEKLAALGEQSPAKYKMGLSLL